MAADISIPLILGTDSASDEFVKIDLARTGNLLLAGATKQGKSHCIHNLIRQIETLTTPPKLILFDPKRCEFSQYKERYKVIEGLEDAKNVLFEELLLFAHKLQVAQYHLIPFHQQVMIQYNVMVV